MLKTVFPILLCILFFSAGAQTLSKDQMRELLKQPHPDSLISLYGRDNVLYQLTQFALTDKIELSDIWYSSSTIDTGALQKNPVTKDIEFASLKLKAIYLAWLIYNNNIQQSAEIAALNHKQFGRHIFDYRSQDIKNPWEGFMITYTIDIAVITKYFQKWGSILKKKGFAYLQEQHLSPLENNYDFVIQKKK